MRPMAQKQRTLEPIFLTETTLNEYRATVAKMEAELKLVMQRLKEAREMGDLSENGAYQYAKFELGSLRRKLAQLKPILSRAQVLQPSSSSIVILGSTVSIQAGSISKTVRIVSHYEADPSENTISEKSPLGSALMGKKPGELVVVKTPRGSVQYQVIKLS